MNSSLFECAFIMFIKKWLADLKNWKGSSAFHFDSSLDIINGTG